MSDAEWRFVAPYLCPLAEDGGQRVYDLRDLFDALRRMTRSGSPGRYLPKDLPPWAAVYRQARRWFDAGCFEAIVHDLRAVLRLAQGRAPQPTAVILDRRAIQSTPESGPRAGYDGGKKRKGSKVHMAVDTPGHLLALHITPADERDRARVAALCEAVQKVTGESVEIAFVDQGDTGDDPDGDAASYGIDLEVIKLPEAKRGFVLLRRRWAVERSFGWMARFRRLARDYERLDTTLAGLHYVAFGILMLHKAVPHLDYSS